MLPMTVAYVAHDGFYDCVRFKRSATDSAITTPNISTWSPPSPISPPCGACAACSRVKSPCLNLLAQISLQLDHESNLLALTTTVMQSNMEDVVSLFSNMCTSEREIREKKHRGDNCMLGQAYFQAPEVLRLSANMHLLPPISCTTSCSPTPSTHALTQIRRPRGAMHGRTKAELSNPKQKRLMELEARNYQGLLEVSKCRD